MKTRKKHLNLELVKSKKQLNDSSNQNNGAEAFINYCKKYTEIQELDCEIIRAFIKRFLYIHLKRLMNIELKESKLFIISLVQFTNKKMSSH